MNVSFVECVAEFGGIWKYNYSNIVWFPFNPALQRAWKQLVCWLLMEFTDSQIIEFCIIRLESSEIWYLLFWYMGMNVSEKHLYPYSEGKNKCWYLLTKLRGSISQKTIIWTLTTARIITLDNCKIFITYAVKIQITMDWFSILQNTK